MQSQSRIWQAALALLLSALNPLALRAQIASASNLDTAPPSAIASLPFPGQDKNDSASQTPRSEAKTSGIGGKFKYYLTDTYQITALTAPAFAAGVRMAYPPGKGATRYPAEWRQGAEGFGRNYGDASAQRVTFHTARFLTGIVTRENPRYEPSTSHNVFARGLHAIGYTFVDRSDGGHPMPAISSFVGAGAAGFVGNAYLPSGYSNVTHAGQRVTLSFGLFAAQNVYREFAPQLPRVVRVLVALIGG